eukprot:scpid83426/ scgid15868/ 
MPGSFHFDEISDNEYLVQHYTGLPSPGHFSTLLDVCERFVPFRYHSGWQVKVLSHTDQLVLTLMQLYCGFSNIDLGVPFAVSDNTISNVTHTWICLLHEAVA